jgi:hypothetical protein
MGAGGSGGGGICCAGGAWLNPTPPGTGGASGAFLGANPCEIGGGVFGRAPAPPAGGPLPGMNPGGAPYGTLDPEFAGAGAEFSAATDPGFGAFAGATPNPTGGGGKDVFCACGGCDVFGGAVAFVGTGACPCACSCVIGGGARGAASLRCAPVPMTAEVMMFDPGAD